MTLAHLAENPLGQFEAVIVVTLSVNVFLSSSGIHPHYCFGIFVFLCSYFLFFITHFSLEQTQRPIRKRRRKNETKQKLGIMPLFVLSTNYHIFMTSTVLPTVLTSHCSCSHEEGIRDCTLGFLSRWISLFGFPSNDPRITSLIRVLPSS